MPRGKRIPGFNQILERKQEKFVEQLHACRSKYFTEVKSGQEQSTSKLSILTSASSELQSTEAGGSESAMSPAVPEKPRFRLKLPHEDIPEPEKRERSVFSKNKFLAHKMQSSMLSAIFDRPKRGGEKFNFRLHERPSNVRIPGVFGPFVIPSAPMGGRNVVAYVINNKVVQLSLEESTALRYGIEPRFQRIPEERQKMEELLNTEDVKIIYPGSGMTKKFFLNPIPQFSSLGEESSLSMASIAREERDRMAAMNEAYNKEKAVKREMRLKKEQEDRKHKIRLLFNEAVDYITPTNMEEKISYFLASDITGSSVASEIKLSEFSGELGKAPEALRAERLAKLKEL